MACGTSTTDLSLPRRRPAIEPREGRVRGRRVARGAGRRGFTLIEAMIASTVLAVAVIAVGASLSTSVRQTGVVEEDSTALLLARQLMEEIAAKPFLDPVTGTVTTNAAAAVNAAAAAAAAEGSGTPARAAYDDVGDYHGYTDVVDSSKPVVSLKGKKSNLAYGRTYTRTVSVAFRAAPSGAAATTGDFALVTVSVSMSGGRSVSVWRMATNATLMQGSAL